MTVPESPTMEMVLPSFRSSSGAETLGVGMPSQPAWMSIILTCGRSSWL